jgi:hypothetical protein
MTKSMKEIDSTEEIATLVCYKRVYTLPVYTPGPPGPRWNKNDKNTYTAIVYITVFLLL